VDQCSNCPADVAVPE